MIGRSRTATSSVDGRQRLAPARRAAPGGRRLLDRRPRLDERDRGERQARHSARSSTTATGSRSARPSSSSGARCRVTCSPLDASTRRCSSSRSRFLVLLYLFIWRDRALGEQGLSDGAPQESIILGRGEAARAARAQLALPRRRALVVLESPALAAGDDDRARRADASIGRGGAERRSGSTATSSRPRSTRASSRAATALWVEDLGSTNGTFVNGARSTTPRRLAPGDVVRIGADRPAGARREDRPRRAAVDRHRAPAPRRTRTRSSASRRSSRSPTGWAARRPARSRRGSRRPRSRSGARDGTRRGARRRADPGGEPPRLPALASRTRTRPGWARR